MLKEQMTKLAVGWQPSDNPHEQAELAADHIAMQLRAAISQRGRASLALSGGSTPVLLMERLEQMSLEWEKVTITQVDERWVLPSDASSNAGLIQRCMPSALRRARWLPLYRGESLQGDAQHAAIMLTGLKPLDVVVLGMGEDGHTASLFPHHKELVSWLNPKGAELCVAVPAEDGRLARLSMTASALQGAGCWVLVIAGEKKYQTLAAALQLDDQQAMPIKAFLKPPLDIYYCP